MATPVFTIPSRPLNFLITGCSSGFGLSLARIAQAGGHHVIATSRNPPATPSLVSEIESKGGKWLALDVTSPSTSSIVQSLEKEGTHIDVLVNNAGYLGFAPIEMATEDELRAMMEAMYFGPLRLIKAVLPGMRQRRFGIVVNISSGASLEAGPTMGGYAGAKGALDALTKALAKEVASFNIRCLTVVAGTFNTSLDAKANFGPTELPEDYKNSAAGQFIGFVSSGKFVPGGEKEKGMKALYEVIVGEGVGQGREVEKLLLLGSDMVTRVETVQKYLNRGLEVFGDVAKSVDADK